VRIHLDLDVRPGGSEVPERQGAVLVKEDRDRPRVAEDPGDIRGRRERADLQRPVRVFAQGRLQPRQVDPPILVLADRDHVDHGLPPRQLIRVVLVWPDEDDRPLIGRDVRPEAEALVQAGRDAQLEHADEEVDRAGHPGAGEDHRVVVLRGADRVADDRPGVLAEARRL
jgi:hypothetical protein